MQHYIKSFCLVLAICIGPLLFAQDQESDRVQPAPENVPESGSPEGMSLQRLDQLLHQLDENLVQDGSTWQFEFRGRTLLVVADGNADRMRIMSPVTGSADLDQTEMYRLLQANFDTALDARYAVAQDILWSVFIHPLSPLQDQQLASAIAQVYNTAATFGTIYSSGAFSYGGGDSNNDLLEELEQELDRLLRPRT